MLDNSTTGLSEPLFNILHALKWWLEEFHTWGLYFWFLAVFPPMGHLKGLKGWREKALRYWLLNAVFQIIRPPFGCVSQPLLFSVGLSHRVTLSRCSFIQSFIYSFVPSHTCSLVMFSVVLSYVSYCDKIPGQKQINGKNVTLADSSRVQSMVTSTCLGSRRRWLPTSLATSHP